MRWWVGISLIVWAWGMVQAADMVSGGIAGRTITATPDSISLPLAARTVQVCNTGSNIVYVDFDGTGAAGPGRSTSHVIRGGTCKTIGFVVGKERHNMGAVAPSGDTTIDVDVAQE